jgi:hypothetical protein
MIAIACDGRIRNFFCQSSAFTPRRFSAALDMDYSISMLEGQKRQFDPGVRREMWCLIQKIVGFRRAG